MAFQVGARVKIKNAQSQYRANPFGNVLGENADGLIVVQLDGYPAGKGVAVPESDLVTSTQVQPLTY